MGATTFGGNNGPPIGADVYTADGERVGFLMGGDAHELEIGCGFLFIRVYAVPLHCVDRFEDGKLVLNSTDQECKEQYAQE